jgi:hypothetical protein
VKIVPGTRFKGIKQKLYRFHPDISCANPLKVAAIHHSAVLSTTPHVSALGFGQPRRAVANHR